VILMADDDEDDVLLVREALERCNVINRFYTVADGEELMDFLKHRGKYTNPAETPRPHIILLDLNMPKKDGRQALREMREDSELKSIPVIILTTSQVENDILEAYATGANSYITKPATFDGMCDFVKKFSNYWFQSVTLPRNDRE
jgi:CheY-like chemotaxis protein